MNNRDIINKLDDMDNTIKEFKSSLLEKDRLTEHLYDTVFDFFLQKTTDIGRYEVALELIKSLPQEYFNKIFDKMGDMYNE